jgi:hypothetical protein
LFYDLNHIYRLYFSNSGIQMSISLKNMALALAKLYQSMLAHRQPPAPHHIGPYGGTFVDVHRND